MTDIHPYQSFYEIYDKLTLDEHLAYPMEHAYPRFAEFARGGPLIIGEWSLRDSVARGWFPARLSQSGSGETD